ncbi:MAG: hypothetical protein V3575_03880 [Candidatus Absconditabacteria bacterium]
MTNEFVIGVVVSILSAIIAFYSAKNSIKSEVAKLKYDYDKRILDERLKYYPELLLLTQEIGKKKYGKQENINIHKKAYEDLLKWRTVGTGYLVLSKNALECFNSIKDALSKEPSDGVNGYNKEQLEKIFKLRNSLRGALKDDIGIKIDIK